MRNLLVGLSCTVFLFGCSRGITNDEKNSDNFVAGRAYLQDNKSEQALHLFLKEIKSREFAPESHFEAGCLYLYTLNNPYYAIYHFSEFLKCENIKSVHSKEVISDLINTAKKNIIAGMSGNISDNIDKLKLVEILKMTRDENAYLKKKLKVYEDRLGAIVNSRNEVSVERGSAGGQDNKLYTVQAGDTLSTISLKMYGTARDWKIIFDANRDVLKNPTNLNVGQKLVIP